MQFFALIFSNLISYSSLWFTKPLAQWPSFASFQHTKLELPWNFCTCCDFCLRCISPNLKLLTSWHFRSWFRSHFLKMCLLSSSYLMLLSPYSVSHCPVLFSLKHWICLSFYCLSLHCNKSSMSTKALYIFFTVTPSASRITPHIYRHLINTCWTSEWNLI